MSESLAEALVQRRVRESIDVVERLLDDVLVREIVEVADAVVRSYREGGKVLLFGNGGSAADAQHLAAELVGRFQRERAPLPALALTTNTSALTALANDYDYGMIFARQVEAFGRPGDVAVGLSTSGSSGNVVEGLRAAKSAGLVGVALTGERGGPVAEAADHALRAPSDATPRVQEAHALIGHIVCELVEDELFAEPAR